MHNDYTDIRELTPAPPTWFDEGGIPRYCAFTPNRVSDIYAAEAVLLLIRCQGCHQEFQVAMSYGVMDYIDAKVKNPEAAVRLRLSEFIRDGSIHYGDPPNIGCCPAGPSMNCEDIRVLEYWLRPAMTVKEKSGTIHDMREFEWRRDPQLEIELPDAAQTESLEDL